jgi:hypothetical protein
MKRGNMRIVKVTSMLVMLAVVFGCELIPSLPKINSDTLSEDQKLSLASVKQIDAFPFLSMDYFGDADENHLMNMRKIAGVKSNACTPFIPQWMA